MPRVEHWPWLGRHESDGMGFRRSQVIKEELETQAVISTWRLFEINQSEPDGELFKVPTITSSVGNESEENHGANVVCSSG